MENNKLPVKKQDPTQTGLQVAMLRQLIQPHMNKIFTFIDLTKNNRISERDEMFGIFTLERVVRTLDKAPSISEVKLASPEECHTWLKQMFVNLCFDLNFDDNKTLTPGNIEELVAFIKNKYYFFTFSDIHVMFEMLKKGELYMEVEEYGKTNMKKIVLYGYVNITIMYDVFKAYDRKRVDLITVNHENYVRVHGKTTDENKNVFNEAKMKYAMEQVGSTKKTKKKK